MAVIDREVVNWAYPFSAIVGQDDLKLALMLTAVNPAIGGVLARGEKGTAKSTAARSLRELLPLLPGGARPAFVTLPLGATEDMVVGALDFEAAVREGEIRFQPGLLARADRGVLYVDEVNLLDDHLVECVLGAAESGENVVEREGQGLRHAARFILIGTMNPEEGELRPQLLDRFGFAVAVRGETEPAVRVALLRRREAFDAAPDAFRAAHAGAEADLAARIGAARDRLPEVRVPEHLDGFIAEICARNHVAGHRADLAICRGAVALAAWEGRSDVTADDILKVAPLALLHRTRAATLDLPPPPEPGDAAGEPAPPPEAAADAPPPQEPDSPMDAPAPPGAELQDDVQETGAAFSVRRIERQSLDRVPRIGSGRRARSRSASKQGRYVKSTAACGRGDLALDATIRAAAPFQQARRAAAGPGLAIHIREADIREKVRERRVGSFLLFVVDGSGSMGAQRRMVETKAAILSLLLDAYQKRDTMAMVVFRGRAAEVVLPPTSSVERAAKLLAELPVGGRTPLTAGLGEAAGVLRQALRKDPTLIPLVVVMTDGRANAGFGTEPPHAEALRAAEALRERYPAAQFVVVDTEVPGAVRLGLANKLAAALGGTYFQVADLRAEDLVSIAKEHRPW